MTLDRRTFVKAGAAGAIGLTGLAGLAARTALAGPALARGSANAAGGYGPIAPMASLNTGETLISLPAGFQYNVIGRTGERMSDGLLTPGAHDGMAAFQVHGRIRLIRNHEVAGMPGASIAGADVSYDPTAGGGTTTLEVDPVSRELLRSWVSCSGTLVNCAGGPTPWGSWITCEETVAGLAPGQVYHAEADVATFARDHGYCFEVPVMAESCVKIEPIRAMGRFTHEAVAIDPNTGIVYLTEDLRAAGFYRYIPDVPGQLHRGGRLQMLRAHGRPGYDTRKGQTPMTPIAVDWVDIEDPDPAGTTTAPSAVYAQGEAQGAATFGRLEGCWYGNGFVYLNATNGGNANRGQVWRYRPIDEDSGELVLFFESPGADVLDAPDNICVSPRGGLVICEDGGGVQYIRGLTVDGRIFDFSQNLLNTSEYAGSCFSPDGRTLFFNVQRPGLTFAVWGPWERGAF